MGAPAPEPASEFNFVPQDQHRFSGTHASLSHSSLRISSSTSAVVVDSDSDTSTFTAPSDTDWNDTDAKVAKLAQVESFQHKAKWAELRKRFETAKHASDKSKHSLKKQSLLAEGAPTESRKPGV